MISIFKNYIDKRVDERIKEIITDDTLEFRDISNKKAEQEISSFILQKKQNGITNLSTLDFVLNLKLPAEQIDDILEKYTKNKKVKELT